MTNGGRGMPDYEVVVGNIGSVYRGADIYEALRFERVWVAPSLVESRSRSCETATFFGSIP